MNKEITTIDCNEEKIVLYNQKKDKVYTLSKQEYAILKQYSLSNDFLSNQTEYNSEDIKVINELLSTSKSLELIIPINFNYITTPLNSFALKLTYLFSLLPIKSQRLKWIFVFSSNFYRIVEIDLTNSILDKIFNKKRNIALTIISLFLFISITYNYTSINFFNSINFIYLLSFLIISSLLHEFGHYIFYKFFKGKSSFLCFGLLNIFFPVFYMKFFSTYLLGKNDLWKKVLIILGGTIMDILMINILLLFNSSELYQNILLFKIIFNLNPLIKGTDGYYIYADLFSANNLITYLSKNKSVYSKIAFITIKIINTLFYLWLFITLIVFGNRIFL